MELQTKRESRVFHNDGNKMTHDIIDKILNDGWEIVSVDWNPDYSGRPAAVLAVRTIQTGIAISELATTTDEEVKHEP
jgi:hypothetical protein